jgi:glutathione S-transferase
MPFIETQRDDIRALEGVHLFHFATSNCSQRVRFVLEEKGVSWVGHHVDLIKCENATPEFAALNPKGVVPVLVHDGKTLTESNDIIRYVDTAFEGPQLSPKGGENEKYLELSLKRSSDFQSALKLLMHEFLFKPVRRMKKQQLEEYSEGVQNPDLVRFMTEFSSEQGFSREKIVAAVNEAEDIMQELESRLGSQQWLNGDEFGLIDISWVVNLNRFRYMHYPMGNYPKVSDWLKRMQKRPAFKRAISNFNPVKMIVLFNTYSLVRRFKGTSVRQFISGRELC